MAGSQLSAIVASLVALLAAVPGIQRVYAYEPWVVPGEQIPTIMGTSQAIDYWTVRPETSNPRRLQGFQTENAHSLLLRHYVTAGDTAVTTAVEDARILSVCDLLVNTFSLVPQAEMTGPPEITWPHLFVLAETFLVLRTEIRLPVQELYLAQ